MLLNNPGILIVESATAIRVGNVLHPPARTVQLRADRHRQPATAPSGFIDPQGRCVAIYNVKEGKPWPDWADVMSLPRVLSLETDGTLGIRPLTEVSALRTRPRSAAAQVLPANAKVVVSRRPEARRSKSRPRLLPAQPARYA